MGIQRVRSGFGPVWASFRIPTADEESDQLVAPVTRAEFGAAR